MSNPPDQKNKSTVERLPTPYRGTGTEIVPQDPLSQYLAEVRRYPLLTKEQEAEFARDYAENQSSAAARKLVTGNLRLVVKIAMEYRRAWVNVLDLIQEGNIGLAEAVKRYDPYRGVRFSSFARYWIRALILQFILKNFRMISFANTRAGRKLFFRLEKERARLIHEHGEATNLQLAESLEVSEEDVIAATLLKQPTLSLTAPKGGSGSEDTRTLSDVIADTDADTESDLVHRDLMSTVDEHMKKFGEQITDERERTIWVERMVAEDPVSLAELGERYDVSRERVRQIEARIKKRLKQYLTDALGASLELDFKTDD